MGPNCEVVNRFRYFSSENWLKERKTYLLPKVIKRLYSRRDVVSVGLFSSKDLALSSLLSAIYVGYALLSSYTVGFLTHGADTHLLRSIVFVDLAALTKKTGCTSVMGFVAGLVLEFTVPVPVHLVIFPSLLAYGVTYDCFMSAMGFKQHALKLRSVTIATLFSSSAMAIVALTVFTLAGFFPTQILPTIWASGMFRDVLMGIIGGVLGVKVALRITRRSRE